MFVVALRLKQSHSDPPRQGKEKEKKKGEYV